jgi:hypothetical protein
MPLICLNEMSKMKNTPARKYLTTFMKGAGVVLGVLMAIPALFVGTLFMMRAIFRFSFGDETCSEYSRFCAMEPTLYDKLAVYGLSTVFFILAAIAVGYLYFNKDARKTVSKNWPWPD